MIFNLTETKVHTYTYPAGLMAWREFRMEYGGHTGGCLWEGIIWLPPWLDPYKFEQQMSKWFSPPRRTRWYREIRKKLND